MNKIMILPIKNHYSNNFNTVMDLLSEESPDAVGIEYSTINELVASYSAFYNYRLVSFLTKKELPLPTGSELFAAYNYCLYNERDLYLVDKAKCFGKYSRELMRVLLRFEKSVYEERPSDENVEIKIPFKLRFFDKLITLSDRLRDLVISVNAKKIAKKNDKTIIILAEKHASSLEQRLKDKIIMRSP